MDLPKYYILNLFEKMAPKGYVPKSRAETQ